MWTNAGDALQRGAIDARRGAADKGVEVKADLQLKHCS